MSNAKDAKFNLKVMTNKQKTKAVFAEVASDFADILVSFLTMPLGKIMRVFKNHYGDNAPIIGSLTTSYNGVCNLDSCHFWWMNPKETILNPASSFDDECRELRLNINDPKNASTRVHANRGVFTSTTTCFVVSDDLQIFPSAIGLLKTLRNFDISDVDGVEPIDVTFGFSEIMDLLSGSLLCPSTRLSNLILKKIADCTTPESRHEPGIGIKKEETSNSEKLILKLVLRKSSNKVLFAEAGEDFVTFLISLLTIPLGAVEYLLGNNTGLTNIDNLYRTITNFMDVKYFATPNVRNKFMTEMSDSKLFWEGMGFYVEGPRMYKITDDLNVTPCCVTSSFLFLKGLGVPLSDVKEMELEIGLEEGLSILKASLTSTSALTDALKRSFPH